MGDYRGLRGPEENAARGLEWITGAVCAAHDRDGRQGAHDFDLRYTDGRVAAVEHTSHSGVGVRETGAVLAKQNYQLPPVSHSTWLINVPAGCSAKELSKHYAHVICALEREHLPDLDSLGYLPGSVLLADPHVRWFRDRGLSLWRQQPESAGPRVCVLPAGMVTSVDYLLRGLNAAVADLLTVPPVADRLEKILRVGAVERHLFIALGFGAIPDPVFAGLHEPDAVPHQPAALPDGLTHLWISESLGSVLQCTRDGWTAHRPPLNIYSI